MPVKKSNKRLNTPTIRAPKGKRVCVYCESKTQPSYTDSVAIRRYLSDRSKIINRSRTNLCAKHQRAVTREIKRARHLALLPFVTRI